MRQALYDRIGVGYSQYRRPDERIARRIDSALGQSRSVLNVGAGTGSYEPSNRFVVAVEPSSEMIRQRPPMGAPSIQASADRLPFRDNSFDAALAILTIHHWSHRDWHGFSVISRTERGVTDTAHCYRCRNWTSAIVWSSRGDAKGSRPSGGGVYVVHRGGMAPGSTASLVGVALLAYGWIRPVNGLITMGAILLAVGSIIEIRHARGQDSASEPRYAVVGRDNVELHLQRHDPAEWAAVERPMLRFDVPAIEKLFEEYQRAAVFHEGTALRETPWGTREFAFFDPDHNGLTFYRDL